MLNTMQYLSNWLRILKQSMVFNNRRRNMSIKDIKLAVLKGGFSLSELNELTAYVNSVKTQQAKADINVGDNVWVVQKTKRTPGIVEKVNIKKAIVDMNGSRYNVPLSMLEVQ